jgi:ring-1,2-phenylacetyl-CoA epoxidase subunit PaaD
MRSITDSMIAELDRVRAAVASVPDPELPILTIEDLGILRRVDLGAYGAVEVVITPTYSGCPATETIRTDITRALNALGFQHVSVRTVLHPAWTTDWISESGRDKLIASGIAPPGACAARPTPVLLGLQCPQCGSIMTRQLARFGSTACQSQWVCDSCLEPFDHFKSH